MACCLTGFNPRARAGRDDVQQCYLDYVIVSIHAPARGATATVDTQARVKPFQSTRPRGARHNTDNVNVSAITFQSTRPRGARPGGLFNLAPNGEFQSTRPRGARRTEMLAMFFVHVSIHAPARGATNKRRAYIRFGLFQSTRPRGARQEEHHAY